MRILLVAPLCPLPLEKGGAVRIWNIACQLSKRHHVDLLCFIRDEGEKRYFDALKKVFVDVRFVKRTPLFNRNAISTQFFSFIRSNSSLLRDTLFSSRPLLSQLYRSDEMRRIIMELDSSGTYDLIYAETYYALASIKECIEEIKTPILLIEQNIESKSYERHAARQGNPLMKVLMSHDVKKIQSEERFFWNSVDYVGGLSPADVAVISESVNSEVIMLENGVDLPWFSEHISERVQDEVLFVGSFSYFPNVDSLKWLLDEIWPRIKSLYPQVQLRIVGRGADRSLKHYVHEKGYSIDEGVDDIREAFQHATVLLAPLRSGSGTKYKILEALASGLPVVTTGVGAEGLTVVRDSDMCVEETAELLAQSTYRVLTDQLFQKQLAEKGYMFVSTHYDWSHIVSSFLPSIERIHNG